MGLGVRLGHMTDAAIKLVLGTCRGGGGGGGESLVFIYKACC